MKNILTILICLIIQISFAIPASAVEIAPRISDKEIVERLARLEEGQKRLEETLKVGIEANARSIEANARSINQLREDMNSQFDRIDSQFGRIDSQFSRIDSQFDRLTNIMLGILAAFVTLVGGIIWFALWDRRSMVRPFETKVKKIEIDIAANRTKLHSLIDAFRSISKTDERVAEILRKFNLL